MAEFIDLTGQRFGKLVAIYYIKGRNGYLWNCDCDCGNNLTVEACQLKNHRKSCGCIKKYDLTGRKFNRLYAEEKIVIKGKRPYYVCVCECGNKTKVDASKLKTGKIKSCGCIKKGKPNFRSRKGFGEALANIVFGYYKDNAKRKHIDFQLSKKDFLEMVVQSCYYCGRNPYHKISRPTKCYGEFTYNGIDRKNNNAGYCADNCVPCCTECNYKKSNQSYDDFVNWIEMVYFNMKRRDIVI